MVLGLQQGLKEDGVEVSLVKLCEWFGVARRTVYYQATKGQPKLQEQFVRPMVIPPFCTEARSRTVMQPWPVAAWG